ncbi:MAG: response regulator [Vicinamibacterales bacterium]
MTKTALIADDDSSVRSMLGRLLRPLGWHTVEVADGCSAVEKLSSMHIDLMVLDQRMPQLTGTEVLSIIRHSATHADLPVMVVTGASDPETSEAMLSLGVTDYLVKPLRPEFVRERLSRMDRMVRATVPKHRLNGGQERPMDGSVLVVVDADAEHRSFISSALTGRYEVLEVPSAVAALRACIVAHPSIFILGSDVGLMTPEFLVKKLRERRELAAARILLVTAQTRGADATPFDGIITKTLVKSEFSEQFDRIFCPAPETGEIVSNAAN